METIQNRRQALSWQKRFNPSAPKAGDRAPDFTLQDSRSERQVTLSEYQGDCPVALIFGSFT